MSKGREIVEGYTNLVFKKEHVERIATVRRNICNTCEHNSKFLPEEERNIKLFEWCTSCGCPLASKCRSMSSSCPVGKWGAVNKTP